MIFKIAWRNIWRNKRRTLITAGSILFAVLLSIFMVSIQKGAWDQMIDNIVNFYYGYAQVHRDGYWDEQSIDKAFPVVDSLNRIPEKVEVVDGIIPRIESFALASYKNSTTGVMVVGTDPQAENAMTHMEDRLIKGDYFQGSEPVIIVAEGIAKNLNMDLNDTLVLISQGYHGVNAAGKYPIKGIVRFASPDLNKQMTYLPLPVAQHFYGAYDQVTSLAINMEEGAEVEELVQSLRQELNTEDYEVMSWEEMMPDLVEARLLDTASAYVILVVLYIVIGFGILGTILMMNKEREYEYGLLVAIGMNRLKLSITIWLEAVMLGLVGAVSGMIVSFPLVYYFNVNPLDFSNMSEGMSEMYEKFGFEPLFPAALEFDIFYNQALIIIAINSILALYPLIKIASLKPVEAMRA